VPAIGALDDPTSRSTANASDERLLSAATNMRNDPSPSNFGLGVFVVVSLVETQIFWSAWPSRRTNGNRVQRLAHEPLVVHVGASERKANRHASTVGQYVAFCAKLAAIGGILPSEVPPFGAFTEALSREHQVQSMPRSSS
jgi:hypothetical protein